MRYKATSLAIAVLLLSTPIFAQEIVEIKVETPRTTNPTTVITAQPFTQVYLVQFLDLTAQGEEIVVQEKSLNLGTIGNFEVLDFDVVKTMRLDKPLPEHWWYVYYTLRIINPEKMPYVIPPVTIEWVKKEVGQDISDPSLKVNADLKTDVVHLNYVSTIPAKETYFDIRDWVNFGSFGFRAVSFRVASWFFGTVPLLIFAIVVVRSFRSVRRSQEAGLSGDTPKGDDSGVSALKIITRKTALRNLKRSLKGFYRLNFNTASKEDFFAVEVNLSRALNDFLRTELHLNVGSTPSDMLLHIQQKVKDGRYKNLLTGLAERAVLYYQDVERGSCVSTSDFTNRTLNLRKVLKDMRWRSSLFNLLRRR